MPKLSEHLTSLGQPVVVYPKMVRFLGSWPAAAFVAHLTWWEGKGDAVHWIYKTREELLEEIGLSRRQQESVRANLRERGYLIEEKRGVPCRVYYRLDWDAINRDWEVFVANGCQLARNGPTEEVESEQPVEAAAVAENSQLAQNSPTSRHETAQLVGTKPPNLPGGNEPPRTGEVAERETERETKAAVPPSGNPKQERVDGLLKDTRKRIEKTVAERNTGRRKRTKLISLDEATPDIRVVMDEFWTGWKQMHGKYPPGWLLKEVSQAATLIRRVGSPLVAAKVVRYFFTNWTQLKDRWRFTGAPSMGLILTRGPALAEEATMNRVKSPVASKVETLRLS